MATITATDGAVTGSQRITVIAGVVASVELTPRTQSARTGDVVRFTATARDARGRALEGLTPTWSFSPGHGQLDAVGAFWVLIVTVLFDPAPRATAKEPIGSTVRGTRQLAVST